MKRKTCKKCRRRRAVTQFYKHPNMADGRLNFCKDCVKTRVSDWYRNKMEGDSDFVSKERQRNRKRWRDGKMSPSKKKPAHHAVSNAIRDGRLVPPDNCEDCGHDFSFYRREAHHEDYEKELDVNWLCSLCHGKRHRRKV